MVDHERHDFGYPNYAAIVDRDCGRVSVYSNLDMDTAQLRAITWAAEALEAVNPTQRGWDGLG